MRRFALLTYQPDKRPGHSYSITPDFFASRALAVSSYCGAKARLRVHRTPRDADVESLVNSRPGACWNSHEAVIVSVDQRQRCCVRRFWGKRAHCYI